MAISPASSGSIIHAASGSQEQIAVIKEQHMLWREGSQGNCKPGTLVQTDAHGILASWYGENPGKGKETGLWIARYENGAWSEPQCLYHQEREHVWNPVFMKQGHKLDLFFRTFVKTEEEKYLAVRDFTFKVLKSDDDGISWSQAISLPKGSLGPTKNAPQQLKDSSWLIPSSEITPKTERYVCHLLLAHPEGEVWEKLHPPITHPDEGKGGVTEPCIIPKRDGTFTIFMRNRQEQSEGRRVLSASFDPSTRKIGPVVKTEIPNNDAGIDGIRLKDDRTIVMIASAVTKGRDSLSLLVSKDEGASWKERKLEDGEGAFSQPAVIQSDDGLVHVIYSWWPKQEQAKNIKHLVLEIA